MLARMSAHLLVLLALSAAAASPAAAAVPVLGYQEEGSSTSRISEDSAALSMVGVDGLNLTGPAGAVSTPGGAARHQLSAARAAGRPAVLLVGNFSPAIEDFSEPLAWRTLRSAGATEALARRLVADVEAEGWDGISVDLEALKARDASGLARFLTDLRARLGPDRSLTMAMENVGAPYDYLSRGYDLAADAGPVDQIVLMAYDQHGPWEKQPGPIGTDAWVKAGLRSVLAKVPASKVDLGVAGYGYIWGPHSRQVSDSEARALAARADVRPRWVARVGEWTADLGGGTVVWWSDGRTLERREWLAAGLGLHGVAVWSLGLSDPLR